MAGLEGFELKELEMCNGLLLLALRNPDEAKI
jgi:hypothetical protein